MFKWIKTAVKETLKYVFCPPPPVCGEINLSPGEGTVRIPVSFRPRDAWIDFVDCPPPVPGCSQLEDEVEVLYTWLDGFFIRYKVQTGIRKAKWCAQE